MPAYLLYGDSFLISQALKELQGQVGPPEVLEANSHRVSGAQIDRAQLRAICDAVPFLAERRLVIVEGMLSVLDSRDGRRRPPTSARRGPTTGPRRPPLAIWEDLAQYIGEEMPPTTLLVFLEEKVSRGNALLARLKSVVQVQEHPTPLREGLARWTRTQANQKGARITPGAIRLLSQLVGGNLWTMDNELEKLALYAGDRSIEEGDVRLLVPQSREASVFSAIDALLEGRSGIALRLMHRLRDEGAELPYIISMIARQLRQVTLARDLLDRGYGDKDIGSRLGLSHDLALRRTIEQAGKHSLSSLKWRYERLMEADLAVKQGRMEQDLTLELLVSEASGSLGDPGHRLR